MNEWMQEVPKALLPVANRPVLSYVLEQLELSNLKDLIVVSSSFFFFRLRVVFCLLWGEKEKESNEGKEKE